MTVPTITALPEIPAYSDANFETKAPAVLSALRNTFISEMNAAIAAINAYDYGAAVNANIITGQVAVANGGTGNTAFSKYLVPYSDSSKLGSSSNFGFNYDNGEHYFSYAYPVFDNGGVWAFIKGGGYAPAAGTRGGLFLSGGHRDNNIAHPNGFMLSSEYSSATLHKFHVSVSNPRPGTGLWSGLTDLLTILSSGNIGIGTTSPAKKLEVEDDSGAQLRLTDSTGNYTDFRTDSDGNLSITPSGGGALSVTVPIKPPSYTVATAPSASTAGAGAMIYVTDDVGGAVIAFSDGTNWRRMTDRAVISTT